MAWPARTHFAHEHSLTVGNIYNFRSKMIEDPEEKMRFLDGDRIVCGYVLPDFQRGHRWTQEQDVEFVESLILGHHPGHSDRQLRGAGRRLLDAQPGRRTAYRRGDVPCDP